jgi:cohesin domain-containing protein
MVQEEDRLELLAAARKIPTNPTVQLPDQKSNAPEYVRTGAARSDTQSSKTDAKAGNPDTHPALTRLKPIDTSATTVQMKTTSDTSPSSNPDVKPVNSDPDGAGNAAPEKPNSEIKLPISMAAMKTGDKVKIPVLVNSSTSFRSAVVGLKFDSTKLAVKSVAFGDVFGSKLAGSAVTPFVNENGKMYVTLALADGAAPLQTGVLAYVEIEALADGTPSMELDKDVVNFLTPDGKNFAMRF